MESNWRFNVWLLGQTYTPIVMIARLNQPGPEQWIGYIDPPVLGRKLVASGGPDPVFGYVFNLDSGPAVGRFPFGNNVFPD